MLHPVTRDNFLDLRNHWRDIIHLIGTSSSNNGCRDARIAPETFTVVAVERDHGQVVEQVGDGPTRLYVFNDRLIHFDPLLPLTS